MDLAHASGIGAVEALLHGAAVKVEDQKMSQVCKLSWHGDDKCIFEIKFLKSYLSKISLTLSLVHSLISTGISLNGLSLSQSYCKLGSDPIYGDSFTKLL